MEEPVPKDGPRYASWGELLAATVGAGRKLHVVIYPPYRREKYMAMHMLGLGWTDTRRYRIGKNKRARSEAYGRRMVWDYIAVTFDLPVDAVRTGGPEIAFTWSPLTWEQWQATEDDE